MLPISSLLLIGSLIPILPNSYYLLPTNYYELPVTEGVTVAERVQYVGAAAVLPALTALTPGQEGPAVIPANIPVRVRPGGRGLAGLTQTQEGGQEEDDGGAHQHPLSLSLCL